MEVSKLVAVVSIVLLVAAVPVISASSDAGVEDGIVQGDADIRDAPASAGSVTVGEYMITFSPTIGISYEILDRDGDSVSFKVVGEQGVSINPSTVKVAVGDDILQPEGGIYTLNGITSDIMVSLHPERDHVGHHGVHRRGALLLLVPRRRTRRQPLPDVDRLHDSGDSLRRRRGPCLDARKERGLRGVTPEP